MSNFLEAAASYYGLASNASVEWATDNGRDLVLVARVPVATEDIDGILARMKTMQADAEALARQQRAAPELPSETRMRDEYNGMDARTKSEFGSFTVYRAWRLGQAMDEVVAGPTEEPVRVADSVPPYVWLNANEITPQQRAMAVGMDGKGRYAVAVEDLTPEQHERAEVARLDTAAEAARKPVQGADIGPAALRADMAVQSTAEDLRADYVRRTVAARGTLEQKAEAMGGSVDDGMDRE